jgi:hypothetical protein
VLGSSPSIVQRLCSMYALSESPAKQVPSSHASPSVQGAAAPSQTPSGPQVRWCSPKLLPGERLSPLQLVCRSYTRIVPYAPVVVEGLRPRLRSQAAAVKARVVSQSDGTAHPAKVAATTSAQPLPSVQPHVAAATAERTPAAASAAASAAALSATTTAPSRKPKTVTQTAPHLTVSPSFGDDLSSEDASPRPAPPPIFSGTAPASPTHQQPFGHAGDRAVAVAKEKRVSVHPEHPSIAKTRVRRTECSIYNIDWHKGELPRSPPCVPASQHKHPSDAVSIRSYLAHQCICRLRRHG